MLAPAADPRSTAWLAHAHPSPRTAYAEWEQRPLAMLPLGNRFDAVRIPARTVVAGTGTAQEQEIAGFLAQTLAGPVIADPGLCYYALLPAGSADTWPFRYAACLGHTHWLAVPRIDRDTGPGPYWAVPMERAGTLCQPKPVGEFVSMAGRALQRKLART
ncbi:hypothetical protein ACFYVL_44265 [Streptomyces sp. NPDC004111]|uniref:hypothetical protein n=1 Tax=Streptomyces sp. NPDC004111 TaxID=3364690 RepID=UPI0036BD2CCC